MVPITLDQEAKLLANPSSPDAADLSDFPRPELPGLRGVLQFLESHEPMAFEPDILQIADSAKRPELLGSYRLVGATPRRGSSSNPRLVRCSPATPSSRQLKGSVAPLAAAGDG